VRLYLHAMINDKIVAARKAKNWTQKALSAESGIAQAVIAKYEKGSPPSSRNLQRLADALGVPIEYFTSKQDEKPEQAKFDDVAFERKLKEARKFSLKQKMTLETVIDVIMDLRKFQNAHKNISNEVDLGI